MVEGRTSLEQRLPWADVCRVVAIFGVILLHTAAPVFYNYRSIPVGFFVIANLIDSLTRVSVPLFLMLSGALLLRAGGAIEIGGVARRVIKVGLPLVFWSLVYVLFLDFRSGKPLDVLEAFDRMAREPVMFHLAFVYMIVGIYVFLPLLQVISDALVANQKLACYFFTLWFLVNSFIIYFPISLLGQINLLGLQSWSGFLLLGSYLTRSVVISKFPARICIFVYLGASLCTFALTWIFNASSPSPVETAYEYLSPNVVIASVAAFLWVQKIKVSKSFIKPLAYISGLTFPVYFMHVLVIGVFTSGFLGFKITSYSIHPVVGIVGLAIATFLASLAITALLRVFPWSTKVIG